MAVVPRVTLTRLPARVLPLPWVLEPTEVKGLVLTSYNLSPPAYHLFPAEREKVVLGLLSLSPKPMATCAQRQALEGQAGA